MKQPTPYPDPQEVSSMEARARRIVHVTNDFRLNATGITDLVRALAVAQAERASRVIVLCKVSDAAMVDLLRPLGVTVVASADPGPGASPLRICRLLRSADVIHVHTVRALAVAVLHAPDRTLLASVSTTHNPYGRFSPLLRLATVPVVLASAAASERRPFIPNPVVDTLEPDLTEAPRLSASAVLYVGALSRRKGTDVLLAAWQGVVRAVPDATLHLVGNRDAPDMERLARRLGINDSVVFEGVRKDPTPFMRAATVFVLPSRREGFPLVALQARRAGVAVVATAVDGTPDALDHGRAGILIPSDDPAALAGATIRLLKDDGERKRIAVAGSQGLDRHSLPQTVKRYDAAYARVRRGRRRQRLP